MDLHTAVWELAGCTTRHQRAKMFSELLVVLQAKGMTLNEAYIAIECSSIVALKSYEKALELFDDRVRDRISCTYFSRSSLADLHQWVCKKKRGTAVKRK